MGTWPARLALGLSLLLTAACGQLDAPGRVAQGDPGGGIGGTGSAAQPVREVGVLGTVRGFSSVLVNGVRVEAGPGFPVTTPFGPKLVGELAEGHVVELSARAQGTRLDARRIAQLIALAGPVEAVERDAETLLVMGVEVALAPDATVATDGGLAGLAPGDRVAVSGLWRNGAVVASRIDPAPRPRAGAGDRRGCPAVVSGVVRAGDDGTRRVGPLPVTGPDAGDPLPDGRFAVLVGSYRDGRLRVRQVARGHPVLPAAWTALWVEAYAGRVHGDPALHGFGHALSAGTRLERLLGRRGVFIGPLRDGSAGSSTASPCPKACAPRRTRCRPSATACGPAAA
ncbi:MAG: DUF5666 domain-containing protein [Xanthomonadales bacterium]|nr:DUF5666 domain-containing protein [Xanthomonadales bacterium]